MDKFQIVFTVVSDAPMDDIFNPREIFCHTGVHPRKLWEGIDIYELEKYICNDDHSPGSAHSAPQETMPHNSQLLVSGFKQFRGPLENTTQNQMHQLLHLLYANDILQSPPESPWHESFFFSAAQSIVSKTFRPIWEAFTQTSKTRCTIVHCIFGNIIVVKSPLHNSWRSLYFSRHVLLPVHHVQRQDQFDICFFKLIWFWPFPRYLLKNCIILTQSGDTLRPTSWRTELDWPPKDNAPQPDRIAFELIEREVTYDVGFLISEFLRCQGEAYRRNWSAPYKYWSQVSQSKVRPGCNAIKL